MSEKGNTCISPIVPTHRYSQERMQNPILVFRAIQKTFDLAWEKIKSWIQAEKQQLLQKLTEDIGKQSAAVGISDVWSMSKLGRGHILLVEKDYSCHGYINPENDGILYLNPPSINHSIITDAVEEIVSIVSDRKGDIVVVENSDFKSTVVSL